jgi:osmotically-inducible protein OsmY
MKDILNCAAAMVAGAAVMYYLDPDMGRRRRALLRDKMVAGRHDTERYVRKSARRASDELRGVAAEVRASAGLAPAPTSDHQMTERIRARMGRLVSRPGAIDVTVSRGRVRLSGHILARERQELISTVTKMDGVEGVDDQMQVHDEPGNVSELQGDTRGKS